MSEKKTDSGISTDALINKNTATVNEKRIDSVADKPVIKPAEIKEKQKEKETKAVIRRSGRSSGNGEKSSRQKIDGNEEITSELDESILLINDGDYKYKRIPGMKIVEKKIDTGSNLPTVNPGVDSTAYDSSKTGSYTPSKAATDVIIKGGILLFLLIVFVLYKSKSSASSRKSSKGNVLKSIRK